MDGDKWIGAAIPEPAKGEAPAAVTHKVQTRTANVQICQTTAVDEVLSTLEIFKRARKLTRMNWADAGYNFSNCLGPIPQLKLDKLIGMDDNYPVTENSFNALMRHFIRLLCLDENAKGTLKQSIERGNWIKPKDVGVQEHHQKVFTFSCGSIKCLDFMQET